MSHDNILFVYIDYCIHSKEYQYKRLLYPNFRHINTFIISITKSDSKKTIFDNSRFKILLFLKLFFDFQLIWSKRVTSVDNYVSKTDREYAIHFLINILLYPINFTIYERTSHHWCNSISYEYCIDSSRFQIDMLLSNWLWTFKSFYIQMYYKFLFC